MKARVFLAAAGKCVSRPGFLDTVTLLFFAAVAGVALTSPAANTPSTVSSSPPVSHAPAYPAPSGVWGLLPSPPGSAAAAGPDSVPAVGEARASRPPEVEIRPSLAHPGYAWLIETVDGQPWSGAGTSLALDSQGQPHIAYTWSDADSTNLRYAYLDGTGWHTETVDAFDLTGIMPSLALDAQDHPHISYRVGGEHNDLKYAYHDGSQWITATVDAQGDTGGFSSLALDAQGYPHISYENGAGCLVYARHDGTDWQIEVVACGSGWYGWSTSLQLDASDRPHISYCDCWPNTALRYAWYDGDGWHAELVDPVDGLDSSLALDTAGLPHISYMDGTNYGLRYARHDGSAWHIEVADGQGKVGDDSSLALDAQDRPHISYYDETNQALRYACFDGAAWITEIVDDGNDADRKGKYTSLALDAQGRPHISYSAVRVPEGSYLRYACMVELLYTVFLPIIQR